MRAFLLKRKRKKKRRKKERGVREFTCGGWTEMPIRIARHALAAFRGTRVHSPVIFTCYHTWKNWSRADVHGSEFACDNHVAFLHRNNACNSSQRYDTMQFVRLPCHFASLLRIRLPHCGSPTDSLIYVLLLNASARSTHSPKL